VTVIFKKEAEGMDGYSYSYYVQADQIPDFVREKTAYVEGGEDYIPSTEPVKDVW